jgi:ABC-2 type transport system ATP-binding protein
MLTRLRLAPLLALAAFALLAPAASARDQIVTSFDGTPLSTSFFPAAGLKPGQRAPTVLVTHGWGQQRSRDENEASLEAVGATGVGPLRRAGFNVLTWDSRGFGESGGTVTVDFKDNEGRDVVSLINWLAGQPEAQLDKAGDPRVGMHGASYAGGVEWVAAAIDKRIDALAPAISWHSLLTALYREDTAKSGWGSALYGAGAPAATIEGAISPAGVQQGTLDPHITSAFASGLSTGRFSAEDRAWFDSRGPADALVGRVHVPTLMLQGTADTLFTPSESMRNEAILRRDGVPHKLIWFCGGHGACLTGSGPAGRLEKATVAWLRHYLAGDASVATGPGFEWLADDAQVRTSPAFPPAAGPPVVAKGAGRLVLNPGDATSGTVIAAAPAANAVNVAIPRPRAATQVVGEPRLELNYKGTGSATSGHVFAQIVDEQRGVALGNQVTPLPVTLDGQAHTVTRPLEGGAAAIAAGARYRLQVIGGSQVYGPVRDAAAIDFSSIRLTLPTASRSGFSGPGSAGGTGVLPASRRCLSRRRFEIRVKRGHGKARLRSAKVFVDGKRVKVRRRGGRLRAVVDLRGRKKQRVRVRIVARTRSGKRLRDTRVYRTCTRKKHKRRAR